MTEAVRRFDPHVVLIDHVPLGAVAERKPALDALRLLRPSTRVILGLRDVLDEPERVAAEYGDTTRPGLIRRYFDGVLVYGDPRVFDLVRAYDFPEDVAARVGFTGYVAVCESPRTITDRRGGEPHVVITAVGSVAVA